MIGFEFDFQPKNWPKIRAKLFTIRKREWLSEARERSLEKFRGGLLGRHSGKIYARRGGRRHQASRAFSEYPANDSGKLLKSLRSRQKPDEFTIGTNTFYAKFLRSGTRKMSRRKMSDTALREGALAARNKSRGIISWHKLNSR